MQDNKIIVLKVNFIVLLFSSVPSVVFLLYKGLFVSCKIFNTMCAKRSQNLKQRTDSGVLITDCRYKEENMNNELLSTKMA